MFLETKKQQLIKKPQNISGRNENLSAAVIYHVLESFLRIT
jgi:hypothetical protein